MGVIIIKVILLRHFKTYGNLHSRYIGVTDESLCSEGILLAKKKDYSDIQNIDVVFSSPMKRCIETGNLLYKEKELNIVDELRECNFGDFENKNYIELSENPQYQKWIDSNGKLPFPNGEAHDDFKNRCILAFKKIIDEAILRQYKSIALVVHGGTIMSILNKLATEKKDFYEWQIKNGEAFICYIDREKWIKGNKQIEVKNLI